MSGSEILSTLLGSEVRGDLLETNFLCLFEGFLVVKARFRVVRYAEFPVEIFDNDPFKNGGAVAEQ